MAKKKIKVNVTFTPGYEKRFTAEILKIFAKRQQEKEKAAAAG